MPRDVIVPSTRRPSVWRRLGGASVALTLLAGCNAGVGTELTRAAAKSVVTPIVEEQFPGLPLAPATDCIIDNAEGGELIALASAASTRDDQLATRIVVDVAQRPDTLRCFGQEALPNILNSL